MKLIWSPWRIKFIRSKKTKGCIFCQKYKQNKDSLNYIVHRAKHCFVILNIYPYVNAHVMVAPYKHTNNFKNLNNEELFELFDTTRKFIDILKKTHKIDGCNVGVNLGKVAGAGIDKHLHIHIVPRWFGDTNFMPVTANTKIISESLKDTYKILKKEAKKL